MFKMQVNYQIWHKLLKLSHLELLTHKFGLRYQVDYQDNQFCSLNFLIYLHYYVFFFIMAYIENIIEYDKENRKAICINMVKFLNSSNLSLNL
jgi:hypothetical protein